MEPSRSITTNSKELTVQKAFVTFGSDSKKLTASNITFDADKETVEFQFDEEIPKGVAATLDIDFKGYVDCIDSVVSRSPFLLIAERAERVSWPSKSNY